MNRVVLTVSRLAGIRRWPKSRYSASIQVSNDCEIGCARLPIGRAGQDESALDHECGGKKIHNCSSNQGTREGGRESGRRTRREDERSRGLRSNT